MIGIQLWTDDVLKYNLTWKGNWKNRCLINDQKQAKTNEQKQFELNRRQFQLKDEEIDICTKQLKILGSRPSMTLAQIKQNQSLPSTD